MFNNKLIPKQQKIDLHKWEKLGFLKLLVYNPAEIQNKYGIS
jgi:hypothetical protein